MTGQLSDADRRRYAAMSAAADLLDGLTAHVTISDVSIGRDGTIAINSLKLAAYDPVFKGAVTGQYYLEMEHDADGTAYFVLLKDNQRPVKADELPGVAE